MRTDHAEMEGKDAAWPKNSGCGASSRAPRLNAVIWLTMFMVVGFCLAAMGRILFFDRDSGDGATHIERPPPGQAITAINIPVAPSENEMARRHLIESTRIEVEPFYRVRQTRALLKRGAFGHTLSTALASLRRAADGLAAEPTREGLSRAADLYRFLGDAYLHCGEQSEAMEAYSRHADLKVQAFNFNDGEAGAANWAAMGMPPVTRVSVFLDLASRAGRQKDYLMMYLFLDDLFASGMSLDDRRNADSVVNMASEALGQNGNDTVALDLLERIVKRQEELKKGYSGVALATLGVYYSNQGDYAKSADLLLRYAETADTPLARSGSYIDAAENFLEAKNVAKAGQCLRIAQENVALIEEEHPDLAKRYSEMIRWLRTGKILGEPRPGGISTSGPRE